LKLQVEGSLFLADFVLCVISQHIQFNCIHVHVQAAEIKSI